MSCRPRERSARTRRKRRHMFSYCNMIYEEHPPSFCYRLHSLRRFIKRRDKVIITSNGLPPPSACGARRCHHITPHQSLRPALLPRVLTQTTRANLIPCLPPPSVDCHMVCLCSSLHRFRLPFHPIVILGSPFSLPTSSQVPGLPSNTASASAPTTSSLFISCRPFLLAITISCTPPPIVVPPPPCSVGTPRLEPIPTLPNEHLVYQPHDTPTGAFAPTFIASMHPEDPTPLTDGCPCNARAQPSR